MKRMILASASPRRRKILSLYFGRFETMPTNADETVRPGTAPDEIVRTLAVRKARAAKEAAADPNAVYIGSDTVVYACGEILGKPYDSADAERMLRLLRGTIHEVWSGVCVMNDAGVFVGAECTRVRMRNIGDDEIARYVASGECADKAGAYAIQGKAGVLIEGIEGSYQNVVGLPVVTLDRLLKEAGEGGLL